MKKSTKIIGSVIGAVVLVGAAILSKEDPTIEPYEPPYDVDDTDVEKSEEPTDEVKETQEEEEA